MSIKLVASDLDGTIIDRNNNISKKNFDAIKLIHKKNIKFVVCTGKSYSVSNKICKSLNADYGVFGNGTQIIDLRTGKELLRKTLSQEDLLFVITLAKRYNFHIHLYTDNEIVSEKLEYMDLRNFILKNQTDSNLEFELTDNILEYIENNDLSVFSIIISTEQNTLLEFQNLLKVNKNIDYAYINKRGKYKDLIIDKNYEYLNVSPTNVSKNEALNFLSDYLKITRSDMLAIGDNVNDVEMVKNSGIGVAVNDSFEDLRKIATYVTKFSAADGAFAEAIFKFVK